MIVTTTENIAGYELEIPKVVSIIEKLKMPIDEVKEIGKSIINIKVLGRK